MIDKDKCQRDSSKQFKGRTIQIGMKVSPAASKYLREQNISPTALFYAALEEVGFNEDN